MADKIPNFLIQDFSNLASVLGLSKEEGEIYLILIQQGTLSVLEASRAAEIPRTNTYRLLDQLKTRGLVEEVIEEKRRLFKPAYPDRLRSLITQQKEKMNALEKLFPKLQKIILGESTSSQPGTKVLFYRGRKGLEQQVWNELRTKDEIVGYVFQTYEDVIGKKLARKYREERLLRKIKTREILSDDDEYLTTAILKLAKTTPYLQNSKWKYFPAKKIKIDHTFVIYNDVVSIYNWYKGEIFGVEIYNGTVASMQKQVFEILWGLAEKPEITLKKKLGKK